MEKQIKSRKRVAERGEVYTAEREVKAMCDLVADECVNISSRFLEPACGNGNFLAEILARKLAVVKKNYRHDSFEYERFSLLAIGSIYGIDIMQDNAVECRERLFEIWQKEYRGVCKKNCNELTVKSCRYILRKNIICGNALSLMCVDENQNDITTPIIFQEFSIIQGPIFKQRSFRLDVLLKANEKPKNEQLSLLDIQSEVQAYLTVNPEKNEYMPLPIREFTPKHYRRLWENG